MRVELIYRYNRKLIIMCNCYPVGFTDVMLRYCLHRDEVKLVGNKCSPKVSQTTSYYEPRNRYKVINRLYHRPSETGVKVQL